MKTACALTLAIFSLLWLVYWVWLSTVFDPPVTWWGPPLAALLTTACVGALRNGEIIRGDVSRLQAAVRGEPLEDGKLVGVAGTLELVGDPMVAPFTQRPCAVCEYGVRASGRARVRRSRGKISMSHITPEIFFGYLQTESALSTHAGRLRLLAYPDLTGVPREFIREPSVLRRARRYVVESQPERVMAQSFRERLAAVYHLATTDTGSLKKDWREVSDASMEALGGVDEDRKVAEKARWDAAVRSDFAFISDIEFECWERRIEPGAHVSAIGEYCARQNALTPALGRHARSCHLWVGDPATVHRQLRAKSLRLMVGGFIGLIAVHAVMLAGTIYARNHPELRAGRGDKLILAAKAGDEEAVRYWLGRGADPNAVDESDRNALWSTESPQVARLLIDHGADINAIGDAEDKETALHAACRHGRVEMIDLLIKSGAQLDVRNALGETPLMKAAQSGELEAVQRLVASGANLNLRSGQNNATALGLARSDDRYEIVEFLRQAGGEDDLVTPETGVAITEATHPAVVACREFLRAFYRADAVAVRKLYSSHTATDYLDTMDWKLHRTTWPGDIDEVAGFVRGSDATLNIVGSTQTGQTVSCEFQLLLENGDWKIVRGKVR
jgi:hypothetical protein